MLTTSEVNRIKDKITNTLRANASISPSRISTLLPISGLQGKLYEADVLATVCENLVVHENLRVELVGGSNLMLKQKGGIINKMYPYFEIWKGADLFAELFTDIYFSTLSYEMKGSPQNLTYGDYHELDIALLQPNQTGYPKYSEVMLAIECKNTSIEKNIIRELLGFRRELSYYSEIPQATYFQNWPAKQIKSIPQSVHMLYCSDKNVDRYKDNCLHFGIILQYHKM